MDLTYSQQLELNKLMENYSIIKPFINKYKRLSFMQLDYAVVHDLTLFTIEPDFDFEVLENKTDLILRALPAIKRIFAQPFIHLKEQDVILPTEAVRIINNNTIQHVSSHSELWTDVKRDEIKPVKLLTRTYEDNYGIYENLVFCNVVDDILSFARTNLRFLKELIYTNRTIEINLLERVNHLNYFLALGKLHTGYSRNFDSYYAVSTRCLNKLQYVTNTIIPRLKRPVYKNNKIRPVQLKLRKTNILSMHKEYHQVYKLAKAFAANSANEKPLTDVNLEELQKDYFFFCEMLSIFAIGHFNFVCDENKEMNLARLTVDFEFKNWKLKLKKVKCQSGHVINISIKNDVEYSIILIPSVLENNEELLNSVKAEFSADEYIVCCPYDDLNEDCVTLDITNIESFRRIQQIVLRGMVYADNSREECPFCQNKLVLNEEKSTKEYPVYSCASCRTEIGASACPATKKPYYYTRIANLAKPLILNDEEWLAKRKLEAQMYFRNITELNDQAEIVCPHCRKVHQR